MSSYKDLIILELKSVLRVVTAYEVQFVNYLFVTHNDVGLIINFGEKKVEVKRKVRALRKIHQINNQDKQDKFIPVNPVHPVKKIKPE